MQIKKRGFEQTKTGWDWNIIYENCSVNARNEWSVSTLMWSINAHKSIGVKST